MGSTFHLKASIADPSAKGVPGPWNTKSVLWPGLRVSAWEVEFWGQSNRWTTKGWAGHKVQISDKWSEKKGLKRGRWKQQGSELGRLQHG